MPEDREDAELVEFTSEPGPPLADPEFEERLRRELWALLQRLAGAG
jgi:hypothetical protein